MSSLTILKFAMEKSLSPEALELVAQRFAVLAEPMRLRLLQSLMDGEQNVSSLVETLNAGQANVSRHLQTLNQAGFVYRRKEGLQVFYGIADPSVFDLCRTVCGSLGEKFTSQARAFTDSVS